MIERISIKNYAIIDTLELELGRGLNAFTGETGAGKSIIVGALGLLLGDKGDTAVIRSGEEKAMIEGEFTVTNPLIISRLKELNIEGADTGTLLVRRELTQSGKGRVFINGLQEPLIKLDELGELLVDIHGQHDHQLLLQQKVHLEILDNYGNHESERVAVRESWLNLSKKLEELKELEQDEQKLAEEKAFWESAVRDMDNAGLQDNEEEELAESLKKMENAEKISLSFNEAHNLLYEDELSVSSRLTRAVSSLRVVGEFDSRYRELLEILEDAETKVTESVNLISEYRDEMEFDQKTMEEAMDRQELIRDFKRKYRKNSVIELNDYARECEEKLRRFENRSVMLAKIKAEIDSSKKDLVEKSLKLSRKRQETARDLSQRIKKELSFLGMEKSDFIVDIKYVKDEASQVEINSIRIKAGESGIDRVEFFISSNVGEEPKPLKKVASGGEISRVMLALKSIFAASDVIDTLIFDEIDVGIGGLTANNVGVKMQDIARGKQVIVITHLAQIASKASQHYFITKSVHDNKTFTEVKRIESQDRINEVARMLGGESEASRTHAREMLGA